MVAINLVENGSDRNVVLENERSIEILEGVKEILTLGNTDFVTVQMTADYFEVGLSTIEMVISNNREELESNGLKRYKGKEVKNILVTQNNCVTNFRGYFEIDGIKFANGNNTLISKRVLLNIGMLLRDSEVAKELRRRLLDIIFDAQEDKGSIKTVVEEINTEQQLRNEINDLIKKLDNCENSLERTMLVSMVAFKEQELTNMLDTRIKDLEEEVDGLENMIDRLFNKDSLYSIRDIGKSLKGLEYTIENGKATFGANNIFDYLRIRGILYRKGNQNRPYAQYEGKYIKMKLSEKTDAFDNPIYVCYFTIDGIKWFFKKLVKEKIIDKELAKEMVERMATENNTIEEENIVIDKTRQLPF